LEIDTAGTDECVVELLGLVGCHDEDAAFVGGNAVDGV
jgi:hypothetical protein